MVTTYFTVKSLAEKFSVTEATVRKWVRLNRIPFIKLPTGAIRFDPQEIDRWLKGEEDELPNDGDR